MSFSKRGSHARLLLPAILLLSVSTIAQNDSTKAPKPAAGNQQSAGTQTGDLQKAVQNPVAT
jgi:hypothetical protein